MKCPGFPDSTRSSRDWILPCRFSLAELKSFRVHKDTGKIPRIWEFLIEFPLFWASKLHFWIQILSFMVICFIFCPKPHYPAFYDIDALFSCLHFKSPKSEAGLILVDSQGVQRNHTQGAKLSNQHPGESVYLSLANGHHLSFQFHAQGAQLGPRLDSFDVWLQEPSGRNNNHVSHMLAASSLNREWLWKKLEKHVQICTNHT